MLTENTVIEATARALERQGAAVLSMCTTGERGVDIVARLSDGRLLHVEAKGQTSSKPETARFGKPFNASQWYDHVAKATYMMMAALAERSADAVALAFPSCPLAERYVGKIEPVLTNLGICVIWVDADLTVRCNNPNSLFN